VSVWVRQQTDFKHIGLQGVLPSGSYFAVIGFAVLLSQHTE